MYVQHVAELFTHANAILSLLQWLRSERDSYSLLQGCRNGQPRKGSLTSVIQLFPCPPHAGSCSGHGLF